MMGAVAAGYVANLSYVATVTADAPRNWWKMDEASGSLVDSGSSPVNAAVASGTPTYSQTAIATGAGNSVTINGGRFRATSLNVPDGSITWEALIYPTAFTGSKYLFGDENSGNRFVARANGGTSDFIGNTRGFSYSRDTGNLTVNTPYHVAWTFDGSATALIKCFLNGTGVAVAALSGANGLGVITNWDIGNWNGDDRPFIGRMQHHAIYTRVLSDATILAHAQAAGLA